MKKKQPPHKPRKALRPAPPPGQDVERERLYGEFPDEAGGIYFCFRSPRHNPFAKHHWARYMTIGRINDDQLKRLHEIELAHGRELTGGEILREFMVPPIKVVDQRMIDAVTEWLTSNMVDEVDHRCQEVTIQEAVAALAQVIRNNIRGIDDAKLNAMVTARAWWKPRPHVLRRLGMFHATDWAFRKAEVHAAPSAKREADEIESSERTAQESLFQT